MSRCLVTQRVPNFFAHAFHVHKIQVAVRLARRTHANQGDFGGSYGLARGGRGREPLLLMPDNKEFLYVRLDDGHQAGIHSIHLARVDVYPDDCVSFGHQAARTNRARWIEWMPAWCPSSSRTYRDRKS